MFCKKCGKQLSGTETACPNCGEFVNNQNMNNGANQPIQQSNNQMNQPFQQQPNQFNNSNMNQPMNQYGQPNQFNNQKNNTTIILVIVLATVIIIGLILFLFVFKKDGKTAPTTPETPTPTTPTGTGSEEPKTNSNTVSYAGYTFTLPADYESEITDSGLLIASTQVAYIINVDYSHTYEEYKNALIQEYPDQASRIVTQIAGKEYAAVQGEMEAGSGEIVLLLATSASSTSTFVIYAANNSYSIVTTNQVQDLGTIINSATQSKGSFAPGSSKDAGKDGIIKSFNTSKESIKFKNN